MLKLRKLFLFMFLILALCFTVSCKKDTKIKSFKLEVEKTEIYVGDTLTINGLCEPNSSKFVITYSVSDNTIATISGNTLTAIQEGKVTVTGEVNGLSDSVVITIINKEEQPVIPNSVTFNGKSIMDVGEELVLTSTVLPEGATQNVRYEVSNSEVARLDNNKLIILKDGTFTIKAIVVGYENVFSFIDVVVVSKEPTSVNIHIPSDLLYVGESFQLVANVYPESASQEVEWSFKTDDQTKEIAIIEDGLIKGLGRGTVYLTASVKSNPRINETISFTINNHLLETDNYKIDRVTGAFGEDGSTEFNVHYHAWTTKSVVYVTEATDTTYENARSFNCDGYYYENLDEVLTGPYAPRNIMHVTIDNLTPGTTYIYRIFDGKESYTDNYTFTTADNSANTSFLYLTDVHYSMLSNEPDQYPSQVSETTIKKALEMDPSIRFIVDGGDLIDTGGNDNIWAKYFSYAQTLKQLPHIGAPGNHEYYINGTGQRDNQFFAIHNAGPINGVGGMKGSSCWFIYNDVLFIMLDSVKTTSYELQMEWMEDLLRNKDYKHSVITFHAPIDQDTTDYDKAKLQLFDKYKVDLVLAGHYHGQAFKKYFYDEKTQNDPLLGVSYFTGGCGGAKSRPAGQPIEDFAVGYIINVTNNLIKITKLYANGNVAAVYEIDSTKDFDNANVTKEEVMKNILITRENGETLDDTSRLNINFNQNVYGVVKSIELTEKNRGNVYKEFLIITPSYQKTYIDEIQGYLDYNYQMKINFTDGTFETMDIPYLLHQSINLKTQVASDGLAILKFDEITNVLQYQVKSFDIYVNGSLVDNKKYDGLNKPNTKITLTDLPVGENNIEVVALDQDSKVLFSESIVVNME